MRFLRLLIELMASCLLMGILMGVSAIEEPETTPSVLPTLNETKHHAHYFTLPTEELLQFLDDPKNRVSPDFKVPSGIKPIVGFWFQIYTKYSFYQTIVYDRDHHEIIYDVVDSKETFDRGLSPVAIEVTIRNRVQKIISGYKQALHLLQRNPKQKFKANTPGARLLALWGKKKSSEWRQIENAIRTQVGQRDKIMLGLRNADRFFPAMEAIFRKYEIPTEITRLPLVESSFNLGAVSKVDAVGVWQFMLKSAKEYLVVDSRHQIDERLSPIKSTYAAAKMFRRNYKVLNDWGLAIIAYNHGAKNLVPIRKKFHGEKIVSLLRQTKNSPLGYASRSFLAEFLAILHAERYKSELYGIVSSPHPDAISIIRVKSPASIFDIAARYNVSVHELKLLNPDIFDLKKKIPAGIRIVLPRKLEDSLVDQTSPSTPTRGIASELEVLELK